MYPTRAAARNAGMTRSNLAAHHRRAAVGRALKRAQPLSRREYQAIANRNGGLRRAVGH